MSKSKLRQEYENVMGVVTGALSLYDAKGKIVYYESMSGWWSRSEYDARGNRVYQETSEGFWAHYEYDDDDQRIYYVDSYGAEQDKRPKRPKIFTDENGVQYKLTEVRK